MPHVSLWGGILQSHQSYAQALGLEELRKLCGHRTVPGGYFCLSDLVDLSLAELSLCLLAEKRGSLGVRTVRLRTTLAMVHSQAAQVQASFPALQGPQPNSLKLSCH